jgi:LysM repeat protein/ABC-type branched-subunit amino acid transport system substrate-binding protein
MKLYYPMSKTISVLFLLFLLVSQNTFAQNEDYTIEKIGGKSYYLYKVESGNTIYAICKKFNVEVEELQSTNPEIVNGLKVDQVLKVPISRSNKNLEKINSPQIQGKYIYHVVDRGETLYFLSKKYDITIDNLVDNNPGIDQKISIGDTIKIPTYKLDVKDQNAVLQATEDNYMRHKVEKGETLYSLAKLYNVSLDSLNNINNNFPIGLKDGATIIIPKRRTVFKPSEVSKDDSLYSYVRRKLQKNEVDEMYKENADKREGKNWKVKVALILPFFLNEYDSLESTSNIEIKAKSRVALSFYKGVQLALDSLSKKGMEIDLYVIDSGNDSTKLKKMFATDDRIIEADIIIGPLYANTFLAVSPYSQKNKTFIVAPFVRQEIIVENQPFSIKITPSLENMIDKNIQYIKEKYTTGKIILMHNEIFLEQDLEKYARLQVSKNFDGSRVKVFNFKSYTTEEFKKYLSSTEKNVIIVPSEDQPFVTDLLTKLSYINGYDISVFGMESWMNFNNIEIPYFVKLNTHFPSTYYVDYEDPYTIRFVQQFHEKFNTEPDFFALKGFDIAYFIMIHFYKNYQFNVSEILKESTFRGIQSDFRMYRKSEGYGLENKKVNILKFEKGKLINTDRY